MNEMMTHSHLSRLHPLSIVLGFGSTKSHPREETTYREATPLENPARWIVLRAIARSYPWRLAQIFRKP
jgi:hypothetical protein